MTDAKEGASKKRSALVELRAVRSNWEDLKTTQAAAAAAPELSSLAVDSASLRL
jgi:hypothetical protein